SIPPLLTQPSPPLVAAPNVSLPVESVPVPVVPIRPTSIPQTQLPDPASEIKPLPPIDSPTSSITQPAAGVVQLSPTPARGSILRTSDESAAPGLPKFLTAYWSPASPKAPNQPSDRVQPAVHLTAADVSQSQTTYVIRDGRGEKQSQLRPITLGSSGSTP